MIKPHPTLINRSRPLALLLGNEMIKTFKLKKYDDIWENDAKIEWYLKKLLFFVSSLQFEIIDNLMMDYFHHKLPHE